MLVNVGSYFFYLTAKKHNKFSFFLSIIKKRIKKILKSDPYLYFLPTFCFQYMNNKEIGPVLTDILGYIRCSHVGMETRFLRCCHSN